MKIYDQSILIKNVTSGAYDDANQDAIDMLDTMLNDYAVPHCFKLPSAEKIEEYYDKGQEALVELLFYHEDEDMLSLVYMLWMKYSRNCKHENLMKAMARRVFKDGFGLIEEV